jgi:hypothetical protein
MVSGETFTMKPDVASVSVNRLTNTTWRYNITLYIYTPQMFWAVRTGQNKMLKIERSVF